MVNYAISKGCVVMKIIGLCGGSGSGKGTVSLFFEKMGFAHVDADAIYREITSSPSDCLRELVLEFGNSILTKEGALDRRRLAAMVFEGDDSERKRLELNRISHKYVLRKMREEIRRYAELGIAAVLVDAPLLFESGFDSECEKIVSVIAERDIRIKRITQRDGISDSQAIARINSQISDESLIEKSDYIIVNNGSLSELEEQVTSCAADILNYER